MFEGANATMRLLTKTVCVSAFAPCPLSMQRQLYPSWAAIQLAGAFMARMNSQPYIISDPGLHCHLLHHLVYSPVFAS